MRRREPALHLRCFWRGGMGSVRDGSALCTRTHARANARARTHRYLPIINTCARMEATFPCKVALLSLSLFLSLSRSFSLRRSPLFLSQFLSLSLISSLSRTHTLFTSLSPSLPLSLSLSGTPFLSFFLPAFVTRPSPASLLSSPLYFLLQGKCKGNYGHDQPAYVSASSNPDYGEKERERYECRRAAIPTTVRRRERGECRRAAIPTTVRRRERERDECRRAAIPTTVRRREREMSVGEQQSRLR